MKLHVIGAGLAGLACALEAAEAGAEVVLHEATAQAGGRCRSFHDPLLDRMVDNGSHLLLTANAEVLDFLKRGGGHSLLHEITPARFPMYDLTKGRLHMIRPGKIPPGLGWRDLWGVWQLRKGRGTVADCLRKAPLYRLLWQPLCEAALNTAPEEASAALLWQVLKESLLAGEKASRPLIVEKGLGPTFIAPVLARLTALGAEIRFGHRLRAIEEDALVFDDGRIGFGHAVLALPNAAAADLLPQQVERLPHRAIVNAHYRLDRPVRLPGGLPFLGLAGATAQWLFLREDVLSVTVSAADALAACPTADIALLLWHDVSRALGLPAVPPAWRIIKEQRATIVQTPQTEAFRNRLRRSTSPHSRVFLAGDWTEAGLPCTMEAAIRSGRRAARAVIAVAANWDGRTSQNGEPAISCGHL
ncbi:hydroxysqualene dehydroxylase HpnE [Telmatospirillum sp. J64-1]|uniref:hydroxysqualene dehydroxylase HpnE n=1 Tax=Telmatospirillum sp. J64-1 TaxID=2502183 RepID=UPI00115DD591|nr:hydroxysqualene dehydroxylase HpnE [Telmatospirillum sp. J64-1]